MACEGNSRTHDEGALIKDEGQDGSDYTLNENERSVWISVDRFSVYIKREDDGVVVDIFPKGDEGGEPIASTWAHASDLPEMD